jgi:MOSC domain-containing protein YiiM
MKSQMSELPISGTVQWLGLRHVDRSRPMQAVDVVQVTANNGLAQDRYDKGPGPRQVTLFQIEHLDTIARLLRQPRVELAATRRNIGVAGINLLSLLDREFQIGECVLFGTGDCTPCNRMNTTIGAGAATAMAGMGGITARVVKPGTIRLGDTVTPSH